MATYNINFSDPLKPSFTINAGGYNGPGSANAQSSLRLYGEAAIQWGESVDENMLRLNENFAGATPPYTPIGGQIWVRQALYWSYGGNWWAYVFSNDTWTPITVNIGAPPTPAVNYEGDYYYDAPTLYYSGSQYEQAAVTWMTRDFIVGGAAPVNGVSKPTQIAQVYNAFTSSWVSLSGDASNIGVTAYPPAFTGPTVQLALQQLGDGKVAKIGDTMTGFLTLHSPPVNAMHAATKSYVDSAASGNVPSGTIVMWSPTAGPVPSGWAACNGTSGTPDLRDRWIVGAGGSYGSGATGGSTTTSTAGNHAHTTDFQGSHFHTGVTAGHSLSEAEMPRHYHLMLGPNSVTPPQGGAANYGLYGGGTPDDAAWNYGTWSTGGGAASGSASTGLGNGNFHSHNIYSDGSHQHSTFGAGDHSHTVTPPYYALIFIMKL